MKYIPGTKFINNTTRQTRLFKRGVVYKLSNIKFIDEQYEYTFILPDRTLKTVKFESLEIADEFLQNIVV
tara:strand:- start:1723 stop:1932 length:210 start_codon:yes stop_codon:yes gene_type:complete